MEHYINKFQLHLKAVNIKEITEDIDFYFQNKSQSNSLFDFISHSFPKKIKTSKKIISHDHY